MMRGIPQLRTLLRRLGASGPWRVPVVAFAAVALLVGGLAGIDAVRDGSSDARPSDRESEQRARAKGRTDRGGTEGRSNKRPTTTADDASPGTAGTTAVQSVRSGDGPTSNSAAPSTAPNPSTAPQDDDDDGDTGDGEEQDSEAWREDDGQPQPADDDLTTSSTETTLDGELEVRDVVIADNGLPLLAVASDSREEPGDAFVGVVACDDPDCDGVGEEVTRLDGPEDEDEYALCDELFGAPNCREYGNFTKIAIGDDGLPVLLYHHVPSAGDGDMKLMRCNDPLCAGGDEDQTVVLDSTYWIGEFSHWPLFPVEFVLGDGGAPFIVYAGGPRDDERWRLWDTGVYLYDVAVSHCEDPLCETGIQSQLFEDVTAFSHSLILRPGGRPLIAYTHGSEDGFEALRVVDCLDSVCTDHSVHDVSPTVSSTSVALALSPDDLPVISFEGWVDGSRVAKVGRCAQRSCRTGTIAALTQTNEIADTGNPEVDYSGPAELLVRPDGRAIVAACHLDHDPPKRPCENGRGEWIAGFCNDIGCRGSDEVVGMVGQASSGAVTLHPSGDLLLARTEQVVGNGWNLVVTRVREAGDD